MKKYVFVLAVVICAMATWVENANALFIISDVGYTSNTVSFTIDGDMTGYAPPTPGQTNGFGIVYYGDIWNEYAYTSNSWNTSVFDNKTFDSQGNTGTWDGEHYSWSHYNSDLSNAVSTNRDIVLTMGNSYLNTGAQNGSFDIIWGHILVEPQQKLYTYNGGTPQVPEPGIMMLLGSLATGLFGFAGIRKKK